MNVTDRQATAFSRRTLLKGVGASALIPVVGGGLSACGGGSAGGSAGDPESGTIVFNFFGDADMQKDYDKLFAKFAADHPKITLKPQAVPGATWADFLNTITTRLAGGQQIDVLLVATEGQKLFASKNLLEPLDDYIKQDQAEVDAYYKDSPPELIDYLKTYASPDGKTYYLPAGYNTMALYVREKSFTDAGVDLPNDDWTWDDFRTAGRAIKQKTGQFFYAAGNGYFIDVMPWLVNNGASTMNKDWTAATFNTPEAVEALTFVRSLVVDGLTPKPGGTYDVATLMAQQKLATFGAGRWLTNDLRRLNAVNGVSLHRFPHNKVQGTVVGWEGWPIVKASKNKAAAWTFVRYLISEHYGDVLTAGGITSVPDRISDATGESFANNAPKNSDLLYKVLDSATPLPAPARETEFQKIVEEAWLQGITGTKTPEVALKEANDRLQGVLA